MRSAASGVRSDTVDCDEDSSPKCQLRDVTPRDESQVDAAAFGGFPVPSIYEPRLRLPAAEERSAVTRSNPVIIPVLP
jgi:hypothetical protein